MNTNEEIKKIHQKLQELLDKIDDLAKDQNSQFTDILLKIKASGISFFDPNEGDEEGVGDSLYESARKEVILNQKASISYLQRKFGIGYSRAAKLIDTLVREDVITTSDENGIRKVNVKHEEL